MSRKELRLAGFVLGLAALVLFLIAGGLVHQHHTAAGEASCPIGHVASSPLAPVAPASVVPATFVVSSAPEPRKELPRKETPFLQNPSRAPPARIL